MKIYIICVGKIKEKYFKDAIDEYLKRLSKFTKLEIIEVKDYDLKDGDGEASILNTKIEEEKLIIKKIPKNTYIVSTNITGKLVSSEDIAELIKDKMISSFDSITFIIGGSWGLSDKIIKMSNSVISFGRITLPHKLFRVVLLEQVYRAGKIIKGEPYHK